MSSEKPYIQFQNSAGLMRKSKKTQKCKMAQAAQKIQIS